MTGGGVFAMTIYQLARRIGLPVALIAAAGLAGTGPDVASASTCVSWTGVAPANPSSSYNSLLAVAVPSPCDAWAVGTDGSVGAGKTLVEHWDGTGWTFMLSGNPGGFNNASVLTGVAAARGASPWAVGYYFTSTGIQTLIETPRNGVWTQVPSPNPGGPNIIHLLHTVAAASATDAWAVGFYRTSVSNELTLIVRWNGTAWLQVPSPDPGSGDNELSGVAAVSATDAWAVGETTGLQNGFQTLILHWNGTAWKRVPSPDPAGPAFANSLSAVAAVSASDAWAVGQQSPNGIGQALIEHWNGTAWKSVPTPGPPAPSQLTGVTVISAGNAWAVGSYGDPGDTHTLIEHWNGTTWRQMPSPSPGFSAELFGVASSSTGTWAVGDYDSGGPIQTLAVHCC